MSIGTRFALRVSSAAFALLWSIEGLSRYRTFHNRTFDLALYARQAWGLAHGDLWDPLIGVHFWGSHVALVLWPLGLLGRVFGVVPVLIVAQALAFGLATLPLAQIGARRFGNAGGLVAAAVWLLYPNLGHVASYEFHPGSLAMLPFALALDALDRARARTFLLACLGVLVCRADFALLGLLLGAAGLVWHRGDAAKNRLGFRAAAGFVLGTSLAYLALQMLVLKPMFPPATSSFDLHFPQWGGSPFGVLSTLIHEPARVRDHFLQPAKLFYLLYVLWPVALLPLFGLRWLVFALPFLAINQLSSFPTTVELYSHYLTPALPAFVVATVDGIHRISLGSGGARWSFVRTPVFATSVLLVCLAAASFLEGGMPWSRDFDAAAFIGDGFTGEAERTVAAIPDHVSVQAPDPLLPHLAERAWVYRGPPPDHDAQVVVLDVSHRARYARREDLLRTIEEPWTRSWLARRDYGLSHVEATLLSLRHGADPRAGVALRYLPAEKGQQRGIQLTRCLTLLSAWLDPHGLELELQAQAPCPNDLALRIGAETRPARVDLLFDGLLSPAQLRDEYAVSWHALTPNERSRILERGLRIGALRSSGAPPELGDPVSFLVPLIH